MRIRSPETWVPVLVGAVVAVVYWCPAFFDPNSTGFGDWQMIHHNWEVGYVALTRHGEWPLWDPYHCGGVTVLGNPESQHFSPFFFLSFIVGTTLATKIMVVLHAWAGVSGMCVLARRTYKLGWPAAILAAFVWGCCGFYAWQIAGGHATFITFYLAPWLLLAWRAAVRAVRYCAALALLMALVLFEGGTYPFPYFLLLLAFDAVVVLCQRERSVHVARAAAVSALLTALLGAIRWLPIRATLDRLPRTVPSTDKMSFGDVIDMFTLREHAWRFPGHEFVWPEYSNFIGVLVLASAIIGAFVAFRAKQRHLVIGALVFASIMVGQHSELSPWALLHRLPVYDSLRVPSRFSILATIYVALLAGLALDALAKWLTGAQWRAAAKLKVAVPAFIVLVAAADMLHANFPAVNRWSGPPLDTSDPAPRFHLVPGRNYGRVYASLPRQNLGTPACYRGNMNWEISPALWVGDVTQARITHGSGRVRVAEYSTNRVLTNVTLDSQARVVFNQNYDPGWNVSKGTLVSDEGRLAVNAPEGSYDLELVYRPAELFPSIVLSVVGLLLTLICARRP